MISINKAIQHPAPARRWDFWLLASSIVVYFFVNLQRSAIPGTIFNELQHYFSATATQVAMTSAVFMYVYAASQLVVGLAADKFGGVRTIIWGALLFCLGSLICPLCSSIGVFLFGRVLVGIGAGTIYLAIVKEIDRIYPGKFTAVLGTIILLGYSGSIVGGYPLSKAVAVMNWRWALTLVAILSLAGYIGFVFCSRKIAPIPIRRKKISLLPFILVCRSRNCQKLFLAGGLGYTVYYLMLAVMGKKILEDICGTSPAVAGACLSVMVVVAGGLNFLNGYWSTRLGNIRKPFVIVILAMSVIGSVMGLIGLELRPGTWYFVVVMLLFAASAGFSSITNSLMREYTPKQYVGSGSSVLNFISYLCVAVAGNLAGYLLDVFSFGNIERKGEVLIYPVSSYQAVFVLALIISVIAAAASLSLPETYGKNIYQPNRRRR